MDLEGFLSLLREDNPPLEPRTLGGILASLDSQERETAIRELLGWLRKVTPSRGAWDAIRYQPPFVLSSGPEGSAAQFTKLLFPFGERKPADFWSWQRDQAKFIGERLQPTRRSARGKWLRKCASDPRFPATLQDAAKAYRSYVELAAKGPMQNPMVYEQRRAEARSGNPDCGHVRTTPRCSWECEGLNYAAAEAHSGWLVQADWKRWRQPALAGRAPPPREPCPCCKNRHDNRPVGEPQCQFCAEALFLTQCAFSTRRWGGWYWLTDLFIDGATSLARKWPKLAERERAAGISREPAAWEERAWAEIERLGTDPWGDWPFGDYDYQPVATVYIPVPVLPEDLKSSTRERMVRLFDELWRRLDIREPRSRALRGQRSADWDRKLDWLWQHRVERKPLESIENADVDLKTIQRAINLAIRTLRY